MSALEVMVEPEILRPGEEFPSGPVLPMMKVLHGGHEDGYISFAVEEEDKGFRPSFAIKASALDSMFPGYAERLVRNSFMSINASYRLAQRSERSPKGVRPGLVPTYDDVGRPCHKNSTLKYLCAAYCDIDCGREGKPSFDEAYIHAYRMMQAGQLPQASMIVNSGRGMWLLWLLNDPACEGQAHRGAYGKGELDSLEVYTAINRALARKLEHLGADTGATDAARYIRVPGSFRTDTETAVWWSIQGRGQRGFSYTLIQLADLLGVTVRRLLPEEAVAIAPHTPTPGRRSGQIAANKAMLAVVNTLIALRGGGFEKGHRRKGACLYAMSLRRCGVSPDNAFRQVREFGRRCSPSFPTYDCDAQCRSGYQPHEIRWSYLKIARTFGVTRSEAESISQRIGRAFPDANGETVEAVKADGRLTRPQAGGQRRAAIVRLLAESAQPLPYRRMADLLTGEGHQASYITVRTDYKALGIETKRTSLLRCSEQGRRAQTNLDLEFEPEC